MNEFREWLSDNLRYIMLGAGIIAVLLILFFGIRFLSSKLQGQPSKESQAKEQQQDTEEEEGLQEADTEKSEAEPQEEEQQEEESLQEEQTPENPLVRSENAEVNELISNYYQALGARDVDTLKTLVDRLDPTEENAIRNSTLLAGYSDVETYIKNGMEEGSYVVIACFGHQYTGFDTVLPGVGCLYVETQEDGALRILSEPTEEQEAYIDACVQAEDTQQLVAEKRTAYDELLAQNPELNAYLTELGIQSSAAMDAEVGSKITTKSNCNVRAAASADSEKLGELVAGQEVTKTGSEGDWIQIEFEGGTGYVRGDLFN